MMAYWALLADQQRAKKMLGQGWVSAPSRAKQRIKPGGVRFVCNPALGKGQHEGQQFKTSLSYITSQGEPELCESNSGRRKKIRQLFKQPHQDSLRSDSFPTLNTQIETTIVLTRRSELCYRLCPFHVEYMENKGSLRDKYPVITFFKCSFNFLTLYLPLAFKKPSPPFCTCFSH